MAHLTHEDNRKHRIKVARLTSGYNALNIFLQNEELRKISLIL